MGSSSLARPPVWYWVGTGVAALYAAIGIVALIVSATGGLSEDAEPLALDLTLIVTLIVALIAIVADIAGAVALIMRRRWAVPAFATSLLMALVYCVLVIPTADVGIVGLLLPVLFLVGLRALFVWLALTAKTRNWLA